MRRKTINTINVSFAILAMWAINGAFLGMAQQPARTTFSSTGEASEALFQAVQGNDTAAITNILGGPTDLASSHDDAQDKLDRDCFVQKYQQMHRLHREADGTVILYIGAENWPFPIPLVAKDGAWRFDSDAGLKEVMFRRIGENELIAISICREFVAAQKTYRAPATAASVLGSSPESLAAKAATGSTGGDDPALAHGYYFRVLAKHPKGGFDFIAYPAEYRSSGVMTFAVTDRGVLYEKDLGANTSADGNALAAVGKDTTWRVADK